MRPRTRQRALAAALLLLAGLAAHAAEIPAAERRSGYALMSPDLRAMQDDDAANPGTLWVLDGEALWSQKPGTANRSCADCHGDARVAMAGVAVRYPAFTSGSLQPVDLEGRINLCRTDHQRATAFAPESKELLALLTAYVANQSRGAPIAVGGDALAPFIARGRETFMRRQGQLNLSCAQCHDDNWGRKLAGAVLPQGHPTGYPLYRLEWQGLGSLQRRLRNCLVGMRAEAPAYGASDYVDLELYLMSRARGLTVETPAVRP